MTFLFSKSALPFSIEDFLLENGGLILEMKGFILEIGTSILELNTSISEMEKIYLPN
ncbi:hypothetical protein MM300_20970 [Evansella sp. LMS18]|jgi:hypothetical protein|uniref:hypothetical protein n=1 Tax=Evansella sp. LMS18 TaxID=2924033 RepID=UPI0020D10217|nr:hypothetical protein [Evansella sp. LMS18]UTR10318.1 hypothetical protein MM300_20970 [Evansella sp. LMS18]